MSFLAILLWLTRRVLPYLYKTKGIGMKSIARKPSKLLAQSTPNLRYIAEAKRGKPAPNILRNKSFPA